jgi:hypothetical protein
MRKLYRWVLASAVVAALLATGIGIGSLMTASASTTATTYYACVTFGFPFDVGTSQPTCPAGSAPISWNQAGPQGQPGTQGPSGPVTATTVESAAVQIAPSSFNQVTATCPTGTLAVAGNYYVNQNGDAGSFPDLSQKFSGPTIGDTSWTVGVSNAGSNPQAVKLHVLCVTGSEG